MLKFLSKNIKVSSIKSNPFQIQSGRFRDGKIESVYRTGWSEDVYIDNNNTRETIGRGFDFARLKLAYVFLFFLFSVLIGKTAWLQVVKGDYYYSMSEGNRVRVQRIEPKRGVIYDRNYNPLVRNKADFMIYFVPTDLPEDKTEVDLIIKEIATSTDVTIDEIYEILSTVNVNSLEAFLPLFIVDNISYENAISLYLKSDNWPGVIITSKTNREYLDVGEYFTYGKESEKTGKFLSMSHILGYTGKINDDELEKVGDEYWPIDNIGKMGIEYFWENELKGVSGKRKIEVDALGKEKKILGEVDAVDGNNLVLSLDIKMQEKLEQILTEHLDEIEPTRGSAVVLDPNNGEILAMVSLPAYDNNLFAEGISSDEYAALINDKDKPLFNRAVSGEFPSGSTIKIVMAAAALEEKVISENTSFLSTGGLRIGQWFFPDWRAGGHGVTNVRKAIAQSVNTFFYIIGGGNDDFVGLGIDRINEYFNKFGLGTQTGVDLAGEADGFVPSQTWKEEVKNEPWYIGDTYHLSIGQGDLIVTPLQVAIYTSFFANGGKIYRPHFVKQVLSDDDKLVKDISGEVVREGFIDDYNVMVVRQGMRETVISGSARSLQSLPVESAGKTGTAQWHSVKKPHAWFTSFAPYDNPEIVVTILVEEGEEGSTVATPIAKEFMMWYFNEYKPRE